MDGVAGAQHPGRGSGRGGHHQLRAADGEPGGEEARAVESVQVHVRVRAVSARRGGGGRAWQILPTKSSTKIQALNPRFQSYMASYDVASNIRQALREGAQAWGR